MITMDLEEFACSGRLFDGHYKLLRPLSTEGGTADVWLAIDVNTIDTAYEDGEEAQSDEETGMTVAIKIYRPKNALDIEGEQRFRDEFKIVYECRHANLLQPTNFSIFEGIPYLVLPYCKNGSAENLAGKNLSDDELWKFILDVASGLERLHSNTPQIIHQDIKPGNILIDNNYDYAITDFGISSKRGGVHSYYYDDENTGTLAYMAPERFMEGAEAMPQSDIWAFGATLCEILTWNVPFGEEGGNAQLNSEAPLPEIPNVSPDIQKLIHACLAKEPGDRPTAKQLVEAAKAKQFPVKSKKPIYITLAVVGALLLTALTFFLARSTKEVIVPVQIPEVPIEERYDLALSRLSSDNVDTLNLGLRQMDSLSSLNYVPAIYQMGFTYGWYSAQESVRRKQVLGIEIGERYMPVVDSYSHMAVGYFTKIMELNDSLYAGINAQAIYRLACYYVEENEIFKKDPDKGKDFLLRSREWAVKASDTAMIEQIDSNLTTVE